MIQAARKERRVPISDMAASVAVKTGLAAAAVHTTHTLISLGAALLRPSQRSSAGVIEKNDEALKIQPERLAKLEQTLGSMYSAKPLEPSTFEGAFAPKAVFQDPAAICEGQSEIEEAFRALRALEPLPIKRQVAKVEDKNVVCFDSLVGYTIGGRSVQLESTLVVKDDGDGRIESITELWNHHELLPMSWVPRRLNGLVSYQLTKMLL